MGNIAVNRPAHKTSAMWMFNFNVLNKPEKMRKFLMLLFILGCVPVAFSQQERTVGGRVVNASDEPLVGVSVTLKGSGNTSLTKSDGTFEMKVTPGAVLSFSYIGYLPLEQAVGDKSEWTIVLREEDKSLEQVVVVGYGTQKRKDLTGAVSSVSGTELAKVPVQNVGQALQGRLAGVQVTMSDGTPGLNPP
ncbi:carboxypeptidase-like regulatory domain-containing protein [Niabella hibiscisoli]|uniref:carboxypeptidase-like regulatory domain-containing protein n=1 Tax=Niabella hibiscisoli TaxID=1825928 RepID=UPI001F0F93C8|nr:carboxypeptidase-like regulatory domain-containing protein [Niabella hibiscisoli]MCH5719311.1 carboxypeptidase-like regulatory domain-containing protein [Niabella hibiscisoli]